MFRFIIIISSLLIISCDSSNTGRTDKTPVNADSIKADKIPIKIDSTLTSKQRFGFKEKNELLFKKYGNKVNDSDIKRAIAILTKDRIIDTSNFINENYFPMFCYMSPSVQLDRFTKESHFKYPDSLKILSKQDKQFILDQMSLNVNKDFKWSVFFTKVGIKDTFPEQIVSIPVFSLDKEEFIVCVENRNSKNCMHGKSWIYYKKKGKLKKIIFDSVSDCRKHVSL